jgi:iron(III) transport system permease protein
VSEKGLLWRVAFPAARPALIAGLSLVAMEVLAEFGASSLYGVQTFTTGIYHAWYQQFSPLAALKIASVLLMCVCLLLSAERRLRKRANYRMGQGGASQETMRVVLSSAQKWVMVALCFVPCALGFLVPFMQLVYWAYLSQEPLWNVPVSNAFFGSLTVAFWVAALAAMAAMLYAYVQRNYGRFFWAKLAIRCATLGYAIPGTVMAVALFIPLLTFDKWFAQWSGDASLPMVFTGSIAAMVIACVIRFLAVAFSAIDPALSMIPKRHDEAAKMLGAGRWKVWQYVHFPLLRPALIMGFLLVAVDTIKELPASLMLRPFDQSTLAIRAYELAVDGRLIAASVPALMVVCVGAVAILVLHWISMYGAQNKGDGMN